MGLTTKTLLNFAVICCLSSLVAGDSLAEQTATAFGLRSSAEMDDVDCAGITRPVQVGEQADAVQAQLPLLLVTAHMCLTEEDLEAWRACQVQEVRRHVPPSYKSFAARRTERAFAERSAELGQRGAPLTDASAAEDSELPVFLAVSQACQTQEELVAWRAVQFAQISQRVPSAFQQFARDAVQGAFDGRLKEIRRLTRWLAPNGGPSSAVAAAMTGGPAVQSTLDDSSGTRPKNAEAPPPEAVSSRPASLSQPHAEAALADLGLKPERQPVVATSVLVLLGLCLPALLAFVAAFFRGTSQRRARTVMDGGDIYLAQV